MDLLARCIDRRFQGYDREHDLVNELAIKMQQLRAFFSGSSLPAPNAVVIAAWQDLPNATMDTLPLSMKAEPVFLRAPPPTPTRFSSDEDDVSQDNSSFNGDLDDDRPSVKSTDSPSEVEFQALQGYTTSEDDPVSRYSYPDQLSDLQTDEEDSLQSIRSSSPSDYDHSSSSRSSPMPMEFHSMVNQWLFIYYVQGMDAFLGSLIVFATMSVTSAPLASSIARAVVRKVGKTSYVEGKSLETAIRSSAMAAFRKHWESNSTTASSTPADTGGFPTPYGVNIASFMGSLFDAKICEPKDVQLCLSLLSEGTKSLDRLCAMHALLVQANDKLCKNRNLPALMQFKHDITAQNEESGEFLWATTARSKMILVDILATIERWMLLQAHKREQTRVSENCTIRRRTMGPRILYSSTVPGHAGS